MKIIFLSRLFFTYSKILGYEQMLNSILTAKSQNYWINYWINFNLKSTCSALMQNV
jgi:hypothetical protein